MQTPVYVNGNKVGMAWLTPEGDDLVITELLIHEDYTSSANAHHVEFGVSKEAQCSSTE